MTAELRRRLIVTGIAVVFIAFGLWAPFEQSINGHAIIEPAHSWAFRHFGSGLIATEWDRNATGRNTENQYFQLEQPDITEVRIFENIFDGAVVDIGDTIASLFSLEGERRLAEQKAVLEREKKHWNVLTAGARPEDLEVEKRKLNESKVRYETYKAEYERVKDMYEQNLSSLAEYQEIERQYLTLEAEYYLAQAKVAAAEAGAHPAELVYQEAEISRLNDQVRYYQSMLGETEYIVSPMHGIVRDKGDIRAIFRVESTDTVVVKVIIPEAFASSIAQGIPIDVHFVGMSDTTIQVAFEQFEFFGGDTTAAYGLATIPNRDELLKPGMHGIASIPVGTMTLFERVRSTLLANRW